MFKVFLFTLASLLMVSCADMGHKSSGADQQKLIQQVQQMSEKLASIETKLDKTSKNVTALKNTIDRTIKANQPPPPPSVNEVSMGDGPVMGNEKATVAIVEFSDFQCPYCGAFQERYFPSVKREYIDTGKVKFVYRNLPLDIHPESENAAISAVCAGEQGKYWAMHDLLFKNQRQLRPMIYQQLAEQLKLNIKDFDTCRNNDRAKQEVRKDLAYAGKIGISGTPAFFIGKIQGNKIVNVQFMEGAQTPVAFSRKIDALLETPAKVASSK